MTFLRMLLLKEAFFLVKTADPFIEEIPFL